MKKQIKRLKLFLIPSKENNYKAPFILSRFLLVIILVLFLLKVGLVFFIWSFPRFNFFADISKSVLLSLTNQTRQNSGLSVLREDSRLDQAAYLKAQDMINYDYFAHTSPSGKSPWYWIDSTGYNYQYAGENLAIDFLDSGEVFQAWLNSPAHRANIVNSKFQDIGMAVLTGEFQGRETTVVVQFFGTELSVPAASAKEPSAPTASYKYSQPRRTTTTSQPSISVTSPMTLYDYYRQKGQPLPSIQERAVLYESFGLGSASSYQGLAWQNSLLVNKLLESDKAKETAAQAPQAEISTTTPTPTPSPTPTSAPASTSTSIPTSATSSTTPSAIPSPKATIQPIFPAGEIKVSPPPSNSFGYKTINFIAQHYDGITRNIFVIVFGIVFLSVCIDVAVKSSFKNGSLILRGTIYSFVLLGLFVLDKAVIIRIIPHSFSVL